MSKAVNALAMLFLAGTLSVAATADTNGLRRYDSQIQNKVVQLTQQKKEFKNVEATVEDGIVTLTGQVDLYQQKLDAAKKVHKLADVNGVRNLIEVSTSMPDDALEAKLDRKLYYDRMEQGNLFNYVTAEVKGGVVTLNGETRDYYSRDSAVAIANTMPGVKDVVNSIQVSPTSFFDDGIRVRAARAIYRDSVLSRYASDPARPIRIVVNNGKLSLYGTVDSAMDKNIAGIRAGQVFGAFSVENNLQVANKS